MPNSKTKPQQRQRRDNVTQLVQPIAPQTRLAITTCHAEGHQWRHVGPVGAPEYSAPYGFESGVARLSTCANCDTKRVRWYTRAGDATNRYYYADGYSYRKTSPDDDAAPTRHEWRQRLVVTLFGDVEQPKRKRAAS